MCGFARAFTYYFTKMLQKLIQQVYDDHDIQFLMSNSGKQLVLLMKTQQTFINVSLQLSSMSFFNDMKFCKFHCTEKNFEHWNITPQCNKVAEIIFPTLLDK